MKKDRTIYYVGLNGGKRTLFGCASYDTPTPESHPYQVVIGPFRTKRGAAFMATFGAGNPHVLCVADAERIAKNLDGAAPRLLASCVKAIEAYDVANSSGRGSWRGADVDAMRAAIDSAINKGSTT